MDHNGSHHRTIASIQSDVCGRTWVTKSNLVEVTENNVVWLNVNKLIRQRQVHWAFIAVVGYTVVEQPFNFTVTFFFFNGRIVSCSAYVQPLAEGLRHHTLLDTVHKQKWTGWSKLP